MNNKQLTSKKSESHQEEGRHTVNKKLLQILEDNEKFEAAIKEGEKILPDRNVFCDVTSRNDPRNDVVLCARIRPRLEKERREKIMEAFIARNPFTFAAEVSFNYKNEARVNYNKFTADLVFGKNDDDKELFQRVIQPLINICLIGGRGLFISYGQTSSGKSKTFGNVLNLSVQTLLQESKKTGVTSFLSFMELQGNSLTDSLSHHSRLDLKQEKTGSVSIVEVIENKLSSAPQFNKMSDRIFSSRVGERQHKSHLICRVRIRPAGGGSDGFLYLIEMAGTEQSKYQASHSADKRQAEQTKQSFSTLRECLRGRASTAANPDQYYHIPYQQSKLTLLLKDVLDVENTKQSRIVVVGNISPTVTDFDISCDTLKLLTTIKAAKKVDESLPHDDENPVNWDKEEVKLWLELSCDVDIASTSTMSGWQLLRMTQSEFVSFLTNNSSVDTITARLVHQEIWQVYNDCRNKEKEKKIRRKATFRTKVGCIIYFMIQTHQYINLLT